MMRQSHILWYTIIIKSRIQEAEVPSRMKAGRREHWESFGSRMKRPGWRKGGPYVGINALDNVGGRGAVSLWSGMGDNA